MNRTLLHSVVLLGCVLAVGCNKHLDQDVLVPHSEAGLERVFVFSDDNTQDSWKSPIDNKQIIVSSAVLGGDKLSFSFDADPTKGKDQIEFVIDRADLLPGQASYPVKQGGNNIVKVTYAHTFAQGKKNSFPPGLSKGWLHITNYDKLYNTIDGRIDIEIDSESDPRGPQGPKRDTYISVLCEFKNVRIPS